MLLAAVDAMHATAWHNGVPTNEPAGYGIKFTAADRDRVFHKAWNDVVLDLEASGSVVVGLSASFWRSCSELHSADLGRWLLEQRAAPWPKGNPPGLAVTQLDDNRFAVRVLTRRSVL